MILSLFPVVPGEVLTARVVVLLVVVGRGDLNNRHGHESRRTFDWGAAHLRSEPVVHLMLVLILKPKPSCPGADPHPCATMPSVRGRYRHPFGPKLHPTYYACTWTLREMRRHTWFCCEATALTDLLHFSAGKSARRTWGRCLGLGFVAWPPTTPSLSLSPHVASNFAFLFLPGA